MDVAAWAEEYNFEVLVHEDWGGPITFKPDKHIPIVFATYDSTLDNDHYMSRLRQSLLADMVLVDHDALHRFAHGSRPVYRWAHAVNDHLFKPSLVKLCDVSFHCSGGDAPGAGDRAMIRGYLGEVCKNHGYSFRSGVLEVKSYARSMAESRVVVNLPRTLTNRPHRVFDTMACGSALLTGPLPTVSGDRIEAGVHYLTWTNPDSLAVSLQFLLDDHGWVGVAEAGYGRVMNEHTWATRAAQLRQLLFEEFNL